MINYASSNINLIGFIFTVMMGLLMLFLPRRFAVLPIIITACYITLGQVIYIAPFHFTMLRIIIFFGLARIIVRKEVFSIRLHQIDKILIAYVIIAATAYILLRSGSKEAFIHQSGEIYNSLFLYVIFRALIHDMSDIHRIFKMIAYVMIPLALSMLIERETHRNLFAIFGGVPEITWVNEGRLRCQGAFAHPILTGTFGATSLPFMVALWFQGGGRKWIAGLGIISATIITVTTVSSGPAMTYIFVIIGMAMWYMRDHMRAVRWIILLSLISLHLVMKGHVWDLMGKLSNIMGGSGWHRVALIDAAISHFGEWWLLGTDYTRHWLPTGVSWSEKHTDITNQFISIGINGGFISVILFTAIIIYCFKNIGMKLKETSSKELPIKFTLWCMGVVLFGHLSSFTSVRYFDQIGVFWYLLLAMITIASMIPAKTMLAKTLTDSSSA